MRRWILYLFALAIGGICLLGLPRLIAAPDPGLTCDPESLIQSQIAYAQQFGFWQFQRSAIAASIAFVLVWSALYLQLFHRIVGRFAWLVSLPLTLVIFFLFGSMWLEQGRTWAAEQKPSCLNEALATAAAAPYASILGNLLGSSQWGGFVYVDLLVLLAGAGVFGVATYVLSRRLLSN